MKILCTSDLHASEELAVGIFQLIENEKPKVYINCGDFLDPAYAYRFLSKLKVKSFIVPGNLDPAFSFSSQKVSVLNSSLESYKGWHFLGLDWAGYPRVRKLNELDSKRLILITHYPPYGVLDRAFNGRNTGDLGLLKFIQQYKPALHCFGHIHEANGTASIGSTLAVNCALADIPKAYLVELPSQAVESIQL